MTLRATPTNVGLFTPGVVLTADHVNSLPAGWLSYSETTTLQGSITTETSLTSLTTGAMTINTGRRIKITFKGIPLTTVSGDSGVYRIKESATVLQTGEVANMVAAGGPGELIVHVSVILTPTAGSHTYNVTLARTGGTGTWSNAASAGSPSYLLVEDIGPAT